MSLSQRNTGVIAAGLALFSMFFGAGDLIWPLILGGDAGGGNFFAMIGLLISGVSLPLLGLLAMMLFKGNYRTFFGQTGRIPGAILIFMIQCILGPFGSIPRLMTLSFATVKPYLPEFITLPYFCVIGCVIVFAFAIKKQRLVDILGIFLCPVLLLSLAMILILGFINPPAPAAVPFTNKETFFMGLNVGYNTLDLIASFIFAPLVLTYFQCERTKVDSPEANRIIFKKMIKSCLIAGGLLAGMYVGLTYLASFYTHVLPVHAPEERLATVSMYLLGPWGALFSCVAVALSCLTTAIPISIISADYLQTTFMKGKGNTAISLIAILVLSSVMANLGFMGIASMLGPILQILCPGLIILCILNILHKMYEMRMRRTPVFAAFALSFIGYLV